MDELLWHGRVTALVFVLAAVTFVSLWFVRAPYGRHQRGGWGPELPARVGWVLMESPSVFLWAGIFAMGVHRTELVPLVLLGLWQLHYLRRTFIYPLRMRMDGKTMPASIALMGASFNTVNAYCVARWVSHLGTYEAAWLTDPRLLLGTAIYLGGMAINVGADERLRALRRPGETGYKLPRGGLFELVASPNYLGEIVQWFGFALATWSLPGLAFAVYTFANLAPRAHAHLAWSREKFADWPSERRALVPFVW